MPGMRLFRNRNENLYHNTAARVSFACTCAAAFVYRFIATSAHACFGSPGNPRHGAGAVLAYGSRHRRWLPMPHRPSASAGATTVRLLNPKALSASCCPRPCAIPHIWCKCSCPQVPRPKTVGQCCMRWMAKPFSTCWPRKRTRPPQNLNTVVVGVSYDSPGRMDFGALFRRQSVAVVEPASLDERAAGCIRACRPTWQPDHHGR